MDPFSSPPPSSSGSGVSNEMMMDQVKQQLAQAYAEEFFGVRISGSSSLSSTIFLFPRCIRGYFLDIPH
jgi:hypothetical protein